MKISQKKALKTKQILLFGVYLLLMSIPLFFMDCSKNSTDPNQFFYPDSNISFSTYIYPIFSADCANAPGCHQSGHPAAGLDLETVNPTFTNNKGEAMVIPFIPSSSKLYRVLVDTKPLMPPDKALPDAKINAIYLWIFEGAKTDN